MNTDSDMQHDDPILNLSNELPGIQGLLTAFPHAGSVLASVAQTLLVAESPISRGDRELIAAYVSWQNNCKFCYHSHRAVASALLGLEPMHIHEMFINHSLGVDSDDEHTLPRIAMWKIAHGVTNFDLRRDAVEYARKVGLTDRAIHDVVLIASAFCMFNRYVDSLRTPPATPEQYEAMGKRLAEFGYTP